MVELEVTGLWIKKAILAFLVFCTFGHLWCPFVSDHGVPGVVGRQIVCFLLWKSDLFLQTAGGGERTLGYRSFCKFRVHCQTKLSAPFLANRNLPVLLSLLFLVQLRSKGVRELDSTDFKLLHQGESVHPSSPRGA